jgi:hypothetical protein
MTRPSDAFRLSRIYQNDPMLQDIMRRYQEWTPEQWTPEQASLDIGYLVGVIVRLDSERETKH